MSESLTDISEKSLDDFIVYYLDSIIESKRVSKSKNNEILTSILSKSNIDVLYNSLIKLLSYEIKTILTMQYSEAIMLYIFRKIIEKIGIKNFQKQEKNNHNIILANIILKKDSFICLDYLAVLQDLGYDFSQVKKIKNNDDILEKMDFFKETIRSIKTIINIIDFGFTLTSYDKYLLINKMFKDHDYDFINEDLFVLSKKYQNKIENDVLEDFQNIIEYSISDAFKLIKNKSSILKIIDILPKTITNRDSAFLLFLPEIIEVNKDCEKVKLFIEVLERNKNINELNLSGDYMGCPLNPSSSEFSKICNEEMTMYIADQQDRIDDLWTLVNAPKREFITNKILKMSDEEKLIFKNWLHYYIDKLDYLDINKVIENINLKLVEKNILLKENIDYYFTNVIPNKDLYVIILSAFIEEREKFLNKDKDKEVLINSEIKIKGKDFLYSNDDFDVFHSQYKSYKHEIVEDFIEKEMKRENQIKSLSNSTDFIDNYDEMLGLFSNFREVLEHIYDYAILSKKGNGVFYIPPILLAGPPGVGKTFFCNAISEFIKTKFKILNMNNTTANFVITGTSHKWGNSTTGEIFKLLMDSSSKTLNPIVLLDEIDKAGSPYSNGGNVENALLGLLERESAAKFIDECIPMPINASYINWFATANNLEAISEPIKSRFDIFTVSMPNEEERHTLIKNIYLRILKKNTWGSHFDENVPEETLSMLSNYLVNNSARSLTKVLQKGCANAIKDENNILLPKYVNIPSVNIILPWDMRTK